jgi:hypothetical protein
MRGLAPTRAGRAFAHPAAPQWARANGCDWDERTCKAAATGGKLAVRLRLMQYHTRALPPPPPRPPARFFRQQSSARATGAVYWIVLHLRVGAALAARERLPLGDARRGASALGLRRRLSAPRAGSMAPCIIFIYSACIYLGLRHVHTIVLYTARFSILALLGRRGDICERSTGAAGTRDRRMDR